MRSKKRLSDRSGLYVILDREILSEKKMLHVASCAGRAGAGMIQLRVKSASVNEAIKIGKAVKRITDRYKIPLVVNDRLEVALAIGADGLHIGRGDIDIKLAKKLLGDGKLIGASAASLEEIIAAKKAGADYLGIGPIFRTPIKGDCRPKGIVLLKRIKKIGIPFFAIGGIDLWNIRKLVKAGFKKAAVIRAVCCARDPYGAIKNLQKAIV